MKIYSLFLLFFSIYGFSQAETEKRLEIDLSDGYNGEQIVSLRDKGFLLIAQKEGATKNHATWKIDYYNTDLELQKTVSTNLEDAKYLDQLCSDQDYVYGLFSRSIVKPISTLVKMDKNSLELNQIPVEIPKGFQLHEIKPIGEELVFAGTLKKKVLCFTLNSEIGSKSIIPIDLENDKNAYLENIDTCNQQAFIFINDWDKKRKKGKCVVTQLDNLGKKTQSLVLNKEQNIHISNGSVSYIPDEDSYFYSGTYSEKRRGASSGIFITKLTNSEVDYFKTHNFLTFKNFLNYLPEKRAEKIERKKNKKEKKGQDFSLSYLMVGHDILVYDDQYIYIGEAYYPTYRTETRTMKNAQGQTFTNSVHVFDGFQYTHAVIASFDKNGDLLWDHVISMNLLYKPYTAKQFIKVQEKGNDMINLAYATGSSIKTLSITINGEINKEENFDIVSTTTEGDKQKWTTSTLEYWYGNYFLMFGNQKVTNKTNENVSKKRRVFYVNKLKY